MVLFSEEAEEGFDAGSRLLAAAVGAARSSTGWCWSAPSARSAASRAWSSTRTTGSGLHIAYTGHSGMKAEALGYWMVDHGAYEVVVPRDEVFSIRIERIPVPCSTRGSEPWHRGGS